MTNVLFLRLRSASEPFDEGNTVELKFDVEAGPKHGELYLRVATSDAQDYTVGDTYVAKMVRVP